MRSHWLRLISVNVVIGCNVRMSVSVKSHSLKLMECIFMSALNALVPSLGMFSQKFKFNCMRFVSMDNAFILLLSIKVVPSSKFVIKCSTEPPTSRDVRLGSMMNGLTV
jgi:hypothetical protein